MNSAQPLFTLHKANIPGLGAGKIIIKSLEI